MSESTNGRATKGALLGLHAQTPMHPGCGTALGTVDLPVQRERHTHWPNIAGSALKGILRDGHREQIAVLSDLDDRERHDDERDDEGNVIPDKRAARDPSHSRRKKADATMDLTTIFGPPSGSSSEFAGSLSVSDGRLLAFPVRSLKGIFAWITCPSVLERLKRDATLADLNVTFTIPRPKDEEHAIVPEDCPCEVAKHVVLEEYEYSIESTDAGPVAEWISARLLPEGDHYQATRERFGRQLIILHDDAYTHFVRYATEVLARIGLDYETKTVKGGALFYQEFLPSEALFYAVLLANPARAKLGPKGKSADDVLQDVEKHLAHWLQVGGDETTGKGYCWTRFLRGGN